MVVGITMSTSTQASGTYNASSHWIKPSRVREGDDLWTKEDYYHEAAFTMLSLSRQGLLAMTS